MLILLRLKQKRLASVLSLGFLLKIRKAQNMTAVRIIKFGKCLNPDSKIFMICVSPVHACIRRSDRNHENPLILKIRVLNGD
ncbi:MAG: hypothetical protein BWK80_26800 [Desulfobacteraceae bacterium IS3]|nr:MAG: hypothetical protein BWK80_26800 [Desulfobacteraceae bacterium IS3]